MCICPYESTVTLDMQLCSHCFVHDIAYTNLVFSKLQLLSLIFHESGTKVSFIMDLLLWKPSMLNLRLLHYVFLTQNM